MKTGGTNLLLLTSSAFCVAIGHLDELQKAD